MDLDNRPDLDERVRLTGANGGVSYPNGRFHYAKNLIVTAAPIG